MLRFRAAAINRSNCSGSVLFGRFIGFVSAFAMQPLSLSTGRAMDGETAGTGGHIWGKFLRAVNAVAVSCTDLCRSGPPQSRLRGQRRGGPSRPQGGCPHGRLAPSYTTSAAPRPQTHDDKRPNARLKATRRDLPPTTGRRPSMTASQIARICKASRLGLRWFPPTQGDEAMSKSHTEPPRKQGRVDLAARQTCRLTPAAMGGASRIALNCRAAAIAA
jgi:hypothetical protein